MATVVIALVSFAVAFVAGGVISKAYFAVREGGERASGDAQLNEQRRRYRKRIDALQRVIARHEDAQKQLKAKLERHQKATAKQTLNPVPVEDEISDIHQAAQELRARLQTSTRETETLRERNAMLAESRDTEIQKRESAENALGLLRIERDELLGRIQRLESEAAAPRESGASGQQDHDGIAARLRAEMGEMRETLAKRDRTILDLELEVNDAGARIEQLQARLETWAHRVTPLTKKLRQQRDLIRQYRQQEIEPVDDASEPADNLKQIRGIGPALERRLNRHGIRRLEQLAGLSEQELIEITEKLAIAPNLAQRDRWIDQARELVGAGAKIA